jgi:hypothetical protein
MEDRPSGARRASRVRACLWLLAVGLCVVAGSAFSPTAAQEDDRPKTSILAVFKDANGAALAGVEATLTVQNCLCSDCRDKKKCLCCPDQITKTSDGDGTATFSVPAWKYKLRAMLPGFKTVEREIEPAPGQSARVEITIG